MIPESDARSMIADRSRRLSTVRCELPQALGLVLAEDVESDIDSPPYDKALVDGYAVSAQDFVNADSESRTALRVLEEVTAGRNPTCRVGPGEATRIMTGAPLPPGADAVIMVEQSELAGNQVTLSGAAQPEQHVLRAGASMRRGDVVAAAGAVLRSVELGVLAEVGCVRPAVIRRPTVAVIATGDELVPAAGKIQPGQIRNSNGPMLVAQAHEAGAEPRCLGIVGDNIEELESVIRDGLQSDLLVLSGGVSAGVLDLVPPTLERCGVKQVFHKVAIKPGKPVWFGVRSVGNVNDGGDTGGTLVFGLPGNPVGSLVCFERLVKPALRQMAGHTGAFDEAGSTATLGETFRHQGPRPTYRPARVIGGVATPVPWRGSADLAALAQANALIAFPPGDAVYEAGALVTCFPL